MEIKREDITPTWEAPKLAEKPNLMTKEKKELLLQEADTKIIELKDKRLKLNNKISDINSKLKRNKPAEIQEAESTRKALIDEKNGHSKILKELNAEKKSIKDKITHIDDQKPEKLKKQNASLGKTPQDEEELEKMLA